MNKIIVIILYTLVLSGCTQFIQPSNNKDFEYISDFKELEGIYSNKGNPSHLDDSYLSNLIWNDLYIPDDKIEYIKVTSHEKHLNVSAISNNCIVHSEIYRYGKDIELSNGKLVLNDIRRYGAEVVGPSYQKRVIGIDTSGDGKYKFSFYTTGLAFFMIPIAAAETTEIRFKKLNKNIEYLPCEKR